MKVGIAGSGSIGTGSAALLHSLGHQPVLWSPSGNGTKAFSNDNLLVSEGAVVTSFAPETADDARSLVEACDVIKIAVPAYGHKSVMDAISPFLESRHVILISSHASFGALYLAKLLAERDCKALIVAWGTTIVSGRRTGDLSVNVNTVRSQVDIATVPQQRIDEGLQICQKLFGEHFVARENLMAISLSNLNPQNHLGIALCNLTRMEKGELWIQAENITPAVGRLLERLDEERLAIAAAFGVEVRDIYEHFSLSFHVARASVAEMSSEMVRNGNKGAGPASLDTRYVYEDVPFGLVPTVWLGRKANVPARLHEAGIEMFNALYGHDFYEDNNLMPALDMDAMSLDSLKEFACSGAHNSRLKMAGGQA